MHKLWSVLFGIIMLLAALSFVVAPLVGWWLPRDVSTFGWQVDLLFYVILSITGVFFILTEGLLVYFMYVYAGNPDGKESAPVAQEGGLGSLTKVVLRPITSYLNTPHRVEMAWTVVPGVILFVLALVQIDAWANIKYISRMPKPDQIFEVSARQFEWRLRYPSLDQMKTMVDNWGNEKRLAEGWAANRDFDDLHVVNEIHTWKGANVRLFLKSQDVLHSWYLPNLRVKQDAVPGKTIPVWFNVKDYTNTIRNKDTGKWEDGGGRNPKTGEPKDPELVWDLVCAELCGWGHYKMQARLFVHPDRDDFEQWLAQTQSEQNRRQ